jgi:polysaccharide biosynthesis/export protein
MRNLSKSMIVRKVLFAVSVVFSSPGFAAPPVPANTIPKTVAVPKDYVVDSGDVLEISVWKEEDLKKEVLVRPDGGMSFPLVGELHAGGKTVDQIAAEITKRLSEFVSEPAVNVAVMKVAQTIYVLGHVNKPGDFVVSTPIDVMQALAMAGGLTTFADEDDIQIIHRDANNKVTTFQFDYDAVSSGKDVEQNIVLHRGDVVVVH